jgi:pSer/pThr/pTyr-binding forkhead associated (FHA) protein
MDDTVLDGGTTPAPQPMTQQPMMERTISEAPSMGTPTWGNTVIEDNSAPMAFAAFRIVKGAGAGRIFDLRSGGDTRIGRDAALNDVVVNDGRVSAQQLIVRSDGAAFGVIDLGSANGTFLNGEKVLAPVELKADDRMVIGDTTMVFHIAHAEEE